MNREQLHHGRLMTLLVIILAALTLAAPVQAEDHTYPLAFRPQDKPYGRDLGAWDSAWWRWAVEAPTVESPIAGDISCAPADTGPVWYLVGSFSGEPITRTCTVPAGTALLVPIITNAYFEFPGEAGDVWREGVRGVKDFLKSVDRSSLELQVDGVSVENLAAFRVEGHHYTYGPLPADNIFGLDAGATARAYSAGYYVMLKPLSPGVHTLHITASADGFAQDVSYTIIVEGS